MNAQEAEQLLESAAAKLMEHFGAVQIFASWTEEGYTKCSKRGGGDWYARQGMAHEFINQDQAQLQAYEITRAEGEQGDGGQVE